MDEQHSSQNGVPPELNPSDFMETPEPQDGGGDQPGQPEPPPSTGVIDAMRDRGYDVSGFDDDESLIKETEARYAAASQSEREMQQYQQRMQQQRAAEQYAQQQYIADEPAPPADSRPQYDSSWADLVEQDPETGRFVVRSDYIGSVDPSIADNVNKYVEWRQTRSNQLIDDPVNTVMQAGLQDQIQHQVNSAVQSAISQRQTRGGAEKFIQDNAEVLYVQDPQTGKTQVNSQGQPVLSPVGRALNDAHVYLRKTGLTDPGQRHHVATQMVQNYFTQQQLANVPQQQPEPQDYKEAYTEQPFAQPTNPLPPGYMPNTQAQPQTGLPEHTSLGSLATALAVHKGFLQPKG